MKQHIDPPPIADIIKRWMPDDSEAEQIESTQNLRRYLAVIYRSVLRREAEGKLGSLTKDEADPDPFA